MFDILSRIDALAAIWMPAWARLAIWGIIGGAISMTVYGLLAPGDKLLRLKKEIAEVRSAVLAHEDDFTKGMQLVFRMLSLSFRRVAISLLPSVCGAIPVVLLIFWIGGRFNFAPLIGGENTKLTVEPTTEEMMLVGTDFRRRFTGEMDFRWPERGGIVVLQDAGGEKVAEFGLGGGHPVFQKKKWWTRLFQSSDTVIPAGASVDVVRLALPRNTYLPFGPEFMRSAEAVFILFVFFSSLSIKFLFHIQ